MIPLLIGIVAILGIVYFTTRNELCQRFYCGHKRKDHVIYIRTSRLFCKIYECCCSDFLC